MAFQSSEHRAAASTDRRARKMQSRNQALQHTFENGSNNHMLDASTTLEDYGGTHHSQPKGPSTPEKKEKYPAAYGPPQHQLAYEGFRSFHETQWRSMLESFPGIHWQGDDPWYLANKKDPITKKEIREWDRVPIVRPQDRSRYEKYKNRKRKDLNKSKEYVVWPPHVERAFEIAWTLIPPVLGKKKLPLTLADGTISLHGRNELISWVIYQLTGEWRDRKQISSHIQVVSKFYKADGAPLLQSLSTIPSKLEAANSKAIRFDQASMRLAIGEHMPAAVPCFPARGNAMVHRTQAPGLYSSSQQYDSGVAVQTIEFDMSLHRTETEALLHNVTAMQSDMGSHPRCLSGVDLEMFPDLKKRLSPLGSPPCDLILFEATISLLDRHPSVPSRLAICYAMEFNCHDSINRWRFRTTRYGDRGKYKKETISPKDRSKALKAERLGDGRCRLSDVPLISEWWVDILRTALDHRVEASRKAEKLLESLNHGTCDCENCLVARLESTAIISAAEDYTRREIQNMSFMQELFVGRDERPVTTFLWTFRQARDNEAATTSWRKIAQDSIKKPSPPLPAPPMILSSSVVPKQGFEDDGMQNPANDHCSPGLFTDSNMGWHTQVFDPKILQQQQQQTTVDAAADWSVHSAPPSMRSEATDDPFGWMSSHNTLGDQQSSAGSTGSASFNTLLTPTESDFAVSFSDTAFSSQATAASFELDVPDFASYSNLPSTQNSIIPSQSSQVEFDVPILEKPPYSQLLGESHENYNHLGFDRIHQFDDSTLQNVSSQMNDPTSPSKFRPRTRHDLNYHQRTTSTLHAPQSRRPISSSHLLSPPLPSCCQHDVHDSASTYSPFDSTSADVQGDVELGTEAPCADGFALAQLQQQQQHSLDIDSHPALAFESMYDHPHDYQHVNPYFASTSVVPATHVLPSNDNAPMSPSHWHVTSAELQQHSAHELQSSLLASAHPQAQATDDSVGATDQELTPVQDPHDPLAFADYIGNSASENGHQSHHQHHASFPEKDNSWVCDIAIAQLEGLIEHANAMDAQLAGATLGEGRGQSHADEAAEDPITAGQELAIAGEEEGMSHECWPGEENVGLGREIKVEVEMEGEVEGEGYVSVEMEEVN